MKKSLVLCLCATLVLPPNASAYSVYGEDNPFVEAMLRMMEIFGLIQRDRLSLGVPYLPGYGQQLAPGFGGPGGMSGLGLGGFPGLSPMPGLGGMPGMGGIPGAGAWQGGGFPGPGGLPGYWADPSRYGPSWPANGAGTHLNGVWELQNGSFVIIQGNVARLYLSRDQYQDFAVYYDRQRLWWRPLEGGTPARYLYQAREGRMIMQDEEGRQLLMRRRR